MIRLARPSRFPILRSLRTWEALCLAALLASPLAGCGTDTDSSRDPSSNQPETGASKALTDLSDPEVSAAVADVLRALTPPSETATSDIEYAQRDRARATLKSMHGADPALGRALLQHLKENPGLDNRVRDGLLAAGTYADPDHAGPLLEAAVGDFAGGPLELDLRQRGIAAALLAEVRPQLAVDLLEPLLTGGLRSQTLPKREMVLTAWLAAAKAIDHPREETLILVATDIRLDSPTRHLAVRELGQLSSPRVSQALMAILTESTGNGILRRKAAQAIMDSEDNESAIASITSVLQLEADSNMQIFLSRALDNLESAR